MFNIVRKDPSGIYLLKANNGNIRSMYEIFLCCWHIALVFTLLTFSKLMSAVTLSYLERLGKFRGKIFVIKQKSKGIFERSYEKQHVNLQEVHLILGVLGKFSEEIWTDIIDFLGLTNFWLIFTWKKVTLNFIPLEASPVFAYN